MISWAIITFDCGKNKTQTENGIRNLKIFLENVKKRLAF